MSFPKVGFFLLLIGLGVSLQPATAFNTQTQLVRNLVVKYQSNHEHIRVHWQYTGQASYTVQVITKSETVLTTTTTTKKQITLDEDLFKEGSTYSIMVKANDTDWKTKTYRHLTGKTRTIIPARCLKNCMTTAQASSTITGEYGGGDNPIEEPGDSFGSDMANDGDLNKDGYDDLVITAPGYDANDQGIVYVFYGPLEAVPDPATADARILGGTASNGIGTVVDIIGDMNNDGYDDMVIGQPLYDANDTYDIGQAYIFYGPVSGEHTMAEADAIITGEEGTEDDWQLGDKFGSQVVGGGDLNTDGFDDVIMSATGKSQGKLYVFYGPLTGALAATTAAATITENHDSTNGLEEWTNLGQTLSAGDANQDGFIDIATTYYYVDPNGYLFSGGYLFNGPFSGDRFATTADAVFSPGRNNDGTYFSVHIIEIVDDLNRDDYADVVIGDAQNDRYSPYVFSDYGQAYVFYGPVSGEVDNHHADVTILGEQFQSSFGQAIASAGDLNSDGYNDLLISAPNLDSTTAEGVGAVYILHGPFKGGVRPIRSLSSRVIMGTEANHTIGYTLAAKGDFNNDGVSDIMVGAPFYPFYGDNIGRGVVYSFAITGS